jgi:Saxitoxin biosynthesis operon protein SxtJ
MPSNQKFGWLFVVIFTVGFLYFQYDLSSWLALSSASLAIIFMLVTIFTPSALAPLNKAWFALSLFLGKIVSPIVLSIIFFILISPVALTTRLFGRDALFLKKRHVTSYWINKQPIESDSFKNQF